jgi:hypothetical protein
MQRIDSSEIFEKAKVYERWILFYDYGWAPSGANKGAFLFWVHRKQIYLKKKFIPLPIYESTEGDCPELDRWLLSHMERTGDPLVGHGWGSAILCRKDQLLTAAPMLIETGITHFTQLVETTYGEQN